MPRRYYGGNSALEQYGGTAFDPLTGRLNGGQLVMQVLNQIAALKEKKQQGEWDIEDRDMKKAIFDLQQQKYGQDIEQGKWEAENRVTPEEEAKYKQLGDYLGAIAKQQAELRKIDAQKKADIEVARVKGAGGDKPSDYDKKAAEAKKLFTAGKISEQEYNRILTGYSGEATEKERSNTRNRIASETRKAIDAGISNKYHENPKDRETMKSALGVDLAMPHQYNIAKRMVESDVADEADYDVIKKYDDLFRFYQEQLKPKMNLKGLMTSEFYKGLEQELKAELVKWYRLKI